MRFLARLLLAAIVGATSLAVSAGVAPATNVLVQPANTTDFGTVAIGQTVTRFITITAPATNTLPVAPNQPVVPPSFTFVPGGTCDGLTQLNPGQSCTIAVNFTPLSQTAGGGVVNTTCRVITQQAVAGFTLNCTTQAVGQFAQFVAAAVNTAVPLMSPMTITLLALGLLGFGARGALRRVRR